MKKRVISILVCVVLMLSMFPISAMAANYSTDYSSWPVPTKTLYYKSPIIKGNDVRWFQCAINCLVTKGDKNGSKLNTSRLDVDGSFGPASKAATIAFQRKYGLSQDGSFGPASRAKMIEMLPWSFQFGANNGSSNGSYYSVGTESVTITNYYTKWGTWTPVYFRFLGSGIDKVQLTSWYTDKNCPVEAYIDYVNWKPAGEWCTGRIMVRGRWGGTGSVDIILKGDVLMFRSVRIQ